MAYLAEREGRGEALMHARRALKRSVELDSFALLELPQEYLDELK